MRINERKGSSYSFCVFVFCAGHPSHHTSCDCIMQMNFITTNKYFGYVWPQEIEQKENVCDEN